MPKDLFIGHKSNGECCRCCITCYDVGKDGEIVAAQNTSTATQADGACVCQQPEGGAANPDVYSWIGGCPMSCCSCFPTGDLCMTLRVFNSAGDIGTCPLDGTEILLSRCAWTSDDLENEVGGKTLCRNIPINNNNIPCYTDPNPEAKTSLRYGVQRRDGIVNFPVEANNAYEKWGYKGKLCTNDDTAFGTGPDDRGEWVTISLCCCDTPTAGGGTVLGWFTDMDDRPPPGHPEQVYNITKENPGDCQTCSYQMIWDWNKFAVPGEAGTWYCSQPSWEHSHESEELVPICKNHDGEGFGCTNQGSHVLPWTLILGNCPTGCKTEDDCDGFLLKYAVSGVYYNCNCCQNGRDEDDDTVIMEATITPCAGSCGTPVEVDCHCWEDPEGCDEGCT